MDEVAKRVDGVKVEVDWERDTRYVTRWGKVYPFSMGAIPTALEAEESLTADDVAHFHTTDEEPWKTAYAEAQAAGRLEEV